MYCYHLFEACEPHCFSCLKNKSIELLGYYILMLNIFYDVFKRLKSNKKYSNTTDHSKTGRNPLSHKYHLYRNET